MKKMLTLLAAPNKVSLQAAVLLGEVGVIWSGFRKQVGDPFLTAKQNRELQRRITVAAPIFALTLHSNCFDYCLLD